MSAADIVIATWDGGGNVGPAVHLGQRLRLRGHRVRVLGWPSMAGRAQVAGLEFASYPSVPPWPEGLRHEDGWERIEEALYGDATARDILRLVADRPPDVLIVDCMLLAGVTAARRLPSRTASLVHVLYRPFVDRWGDGVLGTDVRAMLGSFDRVLAVMPPGLDDPAPLPRGTAYVGPITSPEPYGPAWLRRHGLGALLEPGDPWVLVSLGTTLQQQRTVIPQIVAALASLPVRVFVTLADVVPVESVTVPRGGVVHGFVPHEAVLPYVDLVLCHGGLSTVTTALSFGVPIACLPQGREQPLNAQRVEAVGAGRTIPAGADGAEIREAVASILDAPGFWRASRRFRDPAAGEEATRIVEDLALRPASVEAIRASGRARGRREEAPVRA